MDATSVMIGTKVRDDLADFRDANDHPNYNEAIKDLLSQASETDKPTLEAAN